jgi:hypothetical protein
LGTKPGCMRTHGRRWTIACMLAVVLVALALHYSPLSHSSTKPSFRLRILCRSSSETGILRSARDLLAEGFVAIPDSLSEAVLSTLLALPGSILETRNGADCHIRILVLVVAMAVALAAVVSDSDFAPAASALVQRVRTIVFFPHPPNPFSLSQAAGVRGGPSAVSSFAIHNCIIALTCSRLC